MSIDTTPLGEVAAALMEALSDGYEDRPDLNSVQLGEVLILAEVLVEDDEGGWTNIAWRCSDDREWVQRGLLHAALDHDRVPDEPAEPEE